MKSFTFSVGGDNISDYVMRENRVNDTRYNYIKYFLPLTSSYTNVTVMARTSQAGLIYTNDSLATRQLPQASQTVQLDRFIDASADTRNSISQLSQFFTFFTWFALIVMIVAVGLGVGVVFE